MLVVMSLFPGGLLQVWDVLQNGYWHARSLDYICSKRLHMIEWLRMRATSSSSCSERLRW